MNNEHCLYLQRSRKDIAWQYPLSLHWSVSPTVQRQREKGAHWFSPYILPGHRAAAFTLLTFEPLAGPSWGWGLSQEPRMGKQMLLSGQCLPSDWTSPFVTSVTQCSPTAFAQPPLLPQSWDFSCCPRLSCGHPESLSMIPTRKWCHHPHSKDEEIDSTQWKDFKSHPASEGSSQDFKKWEGALTWRYATAPKERSRSHPPDNTSWATFQTYRIWIPVSRAEGCAFLMSVPGKSDTCQCSKCISWGEYGDTRNSVNNKKKERRKCISSLLPTSQGRFLHQPQ